MPQVPTKTYNAIFPQSVEVKELGITLRPLTLAHFAAIDYMGTDIFSGDYKISDVTLLAWLLQQSPERVMAIYSTHDGIAKSRAEAVAWAQGFDVGAGPILRKVIVKLVEDAFSTAVKPDPPKGEPATTSDSP